MSEEDVVAAGNLKTEVREYILALIPWEQAPSHLRLAFHDAGTYDVKTHTGGAHGAIHLIQEISRSENAGMKDCVDRLAAAKERYLRVSWADLVALGGSAAVEKCGGPAIRIGHCSTTRNCGRSWSCTRGTRRPSSGTLRTPTVA